VDVVRFEMVFCFFGTGVGAADFDCEAGLRRKIIFCALRLEDVSGHLFLLRPIALVFHARVHLYFLTGNYAAYNHRRIRNEQSRND